MRLIIVLAGLILFTACQSDKVSTKQMTTQESAKTAQTSSVPSQITIERPQGSTFQVTIEALLKASHEFQSYISQSSNPKIELRRLRTQYLFGDKKEDMFLLNYGCGVKMCNQTLIEDRDGQLKALFLSHSSAYSGKLAVTQKRIALSFLRIETPITRHKVIMVNRHQLKTLPLPSSLSEVSTYMWPIQLLEWQGNQLTVMIPDLPNADYDTIKKWKSKPNKSTKTLTGIFKDN